MKHKHLTYEDRLIIQQELENSTSLHKIAQRLRKSDSTISREIIRNRYQVKASPLSGLPAALLHAPYQGPALLQRLPTVGG